jgi:YfiH family protein
MRSPWILEEREGLLLVSCEPLRRATPTAHAFSTRRGDGEADLDAGGADPSDARAAALRSRIARAAGLGGRDPILLRQVHGTAVVDVGRGPGPVEGDAAVWSGSSPAFAAAVRTADCVPVLLAREDGGAAAAVHGGWRGISAGILEAVLQDLETRGAPPASLIAAVGPGIGSCCYEVGEEVVQRLAARLPAGAVPRVVRRDGRQERARADLKTAAGLLLEAAGVPPERIHVAPWCTSCRPDLFHSFRRDGARAGRMLAMIGPSHP